MADVGTVGLGLGLGFQDLVQLVDPVYSSTAYLSSWLTRCGITYVLYLRGGTTYTRAWLAFTILALAVQHPLFLDQAFSCGICVCVGWYWSLATHPEIIMMVGGGELGKRFGRKLLHMGDVCLHALPVLILFLVRGSADFSSCVVPFVSFAHLVFWSWLHGSLRKQPFVRNDEIYGFNPPLQNSAWTASIHGIIFAVCMLQIAALNVVDDGVVFSVASSLWTIAAIAVPKRPAVNIEVISQRVVQRTEEG